MNFSDWLALIISATTVVMSSIGAIKQTKEKEKEHYLFLSLMSIVAGLLLFVILSTHMKLDNNPLWYSSFSLLSLVAGFIAGKWRGVRSLAVFVGFVIWLFGLVAMNWYSIDGHEGDSLLSWHSQGPLLPWVFIFILLFPVCGLLSWLGAWLATQKNYEVDLAK